MVREKRRDIRDTWILSDKEGKWLPTLSGKFETNMKVLPATSSKLKFRLKVSLLKIFYQPQIVSKILVYPDHEKVMPNHIVFSVQNLTVNDKLINTRNELALDSIIEIDKVCKQQLKTMALPPGDAYVVRRKTSHGKSNKSKKKYQSTRPKKKCSSCGET